MQYDHKQVAIVLGTLTISLLSSIRTYTGAERRTSQAQTLSQFGPTDNAKTYFLKLFLKYYLNPWALSYKPEGRGFETQWGQWFLSSYLILPAALGPAVYSVNNRNEHHKQVIMFLGSKAAAGAYSWQTYRHLWADYLDNVGSLTSHKPTGLHGLLRGQP
jgi:hypothetical protein